MMVKWLGAILIVAGCGGCGFSMAAAYRREERTLDVLSGCLNWMKCELQYRVTPLPQLFTAVAQRCDGNLKRVFTAMAEELENQISPDAASCMDAALGRTAKLPACAADILRRLGRSLGHFDLQGQLEQMEGVEADCAAALERYRLGRDNRVRSYQTLGLCAGAALAILFL